MALGVGAEERYVGVAERAGHPHGTVLGVVEVGPAARVRRPGDIGQLYDTGMGRARHRHQPWMSQAISSGPPENRLEFGLAAVSRNLLTATAR
jgi:hypothetical protein